MEENGVGVGARLIYPMAATQPTSRMGDSFVTPKHTHPLVYIIWSF